MLGKGQLGMVRTVVAGDMGRPATTTMISMNYASMRHAL